MTLPATDEQDADVDLREPAPSPPHRRTRRAIIVTIGVVVAAAVVAGVLFLLWPSRVTAEPKRVPPLTQSVTRGDLVDRVRTNGKLSYGQTRDLGTSVSGTVTGTPGAGTVVGNGGELFRVNDQPVVLLRGELPMWRSFEEGMEDGPDVLQLERSLAELGFFPGDPDQHFAWSTEAAIERWQKSLGLDRTGVIEMGRVVFSSNDVRIAGRKTDIGSAAGPAVVSVSGTGKVITTSVDPSLKAAVPMGGEVTVVLPNGAEAKAKVVAVGSPVQEEDPAGGKKLTLPLTVTLDHAAAADGFDDADVTVLISQLKSRNALQVPVVALLAHPGGGYAVEVMRGVKSHKVRVQLGAFADGMVEVTKGDLKVGDKVVVGDD